jgi:hypothetical protein
MGGDTPIEGAKVILWQTSSGGYGSSSAVQLATTTTAVGGRFSFTPGYTCAGGQYVYLTSTGGDVADNPSSPITNNNVVLMAALGSCSHFDNATDQGKVNILVNELSTVAAAYTLGNFITVNQNTAGNQLVYVGAPAKNNAATGSCTGTGSSMTCVAAGLAHAFANAANLVDVVHYDGTTATGAALTTVPGNSLGSVPQAQINALGDIMQVCTNSSGGVTGDGSSCGYFFADATPSGGTAPVDTLSAMINVARHPSTSVGGTCVGSSGGLFCLVPSSGAAFQPVLSAVPHDWTINIVYSGLVVSSTSSSWGSTSGTYYPTWLALDANDDVYVLAGNASAFASAVTSTMAAMSSNGTGLWANASTIDGPNGCYPGTVALDTNGNVWNSYAPPSAKSCTNSVYERSAASGGAASLIMTTAAPWTLPGQLQGIALDRYNNLFGGRSTSAGTPMLYEFPYNGGAGPYENTSSVAASVTWNGSTGSPAGTMAYLFDIIIDSNANLYVSNYNSSVVGSVYVIPNLTPTSTPSYTGAATYFTQGLQSTATHSGAIGLDASGNIWAGGATGEWDEIAPTVTTGVITALGTPTTLTVESGSSAASQPYPGQVDGAGEFWFPSATSSGQIWGTQTTSGSSTPPTVELYGCYAPNGATTCSANGTSTNTPRVLQVDSTGALWIAASLPGNVVQMLGPGAPVWPQISYGVFATKPQ